MTLFEKIDNNKALLDTVRPLEGEMLKQTRDYYRVGLTWSSNAIEGNTLTESETKILLEDGLTVGGKPLKDVYEAVGHGAAYDYMFSLMNGGAITVADIQKLHRLFYQSIDAENAGNFRKIPIFVSGSDYVFPAPGEVPSEIERLGEWIEHERDNYHPVEFAALLHLKFVTIHPFVDGNGRTARLLLNLALIQRGYLPVIVPPILKLDYNGFIRKYQMTGEAKPFVEFVCEQELETQKEMSRLLHLK